MRVTERRTRRDFAECIKELVEVHHQTVERIPAGVMDNLQTQDGASLYETFPPAEVRRRLDRLEVLPTPKHGSWLDMAETESSILHRQCLNRRIDEAEEVLREVGPWQQDRKKRECRIHSTFTLAACANKNNHVLCLGRCALRYQLIGSWKGDGDSGRCMLPIDGNRTESWYRTARYGRRYPCPKCLQGSGIGQERRPLLGTDADARGRKL